MIIMEVSQAYESGNYGFLFRIGLDLECAKLIHQLNNGTTASVVRALRGGVFKVSTDNERLKNLVNHISTSADRQRQIRELVHLGAAPVMCQELGFAITRTEFETISKTSLYCKRGRPRALSDKQIMYCHRYWDSIQHPERHDPIDILIQTCEFQDLRATSVWQHIGPLSAPFVNDTTDYSFVTPPGKRPWVRVMFKRWNDAEALSAQKIAV